MTVYIVTNGNTITEFTSLLDAQQYAISKGISIGTITSEERVIDNKQQIASITARQLRLQIVLSGIDLAAVDTAIAQLEEPQRTLAAIEWEYATIYERDHSLVPTIGSILGLSEAELDTLWINGAKL